MKKTTTEVELRRMVAAGVTHGEIAEQLGCARSSVANTCALLGITANRGVRRKPTDQPPKARPGLPSFVFDMGYQGART